MRQQWADYRVFWREFRTTFGTTGAVLPSGRALSKALAHYVRDKKGVRNVLPERPEGCFAQKVPDPFFSGRRILEVGPGTGAVTRYIVAAMGEGDRLELVERNAEFVTRLRSRLAADAAYRPLAEQIALRHAGVEELAEDRQYDVIISGLPLNNFSVEFVARVLAKFRRLLAPGGTLSFFEYIAIRRAKALMSRHAERRRLAGIDQLLRDVLGANEIRRDCVWANIPPAWVHHVRC